MRDVELRCKKLEVGWSTQMAGHSPKNKRGKRESVLFRLLKPVIFRQTSWMEYNKDAHHYD